MDVDPTVRPVVRPLPQARGSADATAARNFSVVLAQLAGNGVQADAILIDLGVSSMQLDRPERGFSYATDAPLDMRMDPSAQLSARDLVNEADERELATIFRRFGEERYATADCACDRAARGEHADYAHGRARRRDQARDSRAGRASATAIRPSVSSRLCGSLSTTSSARSSRRFRMRCGMLRPGGRLAVSFHSLEDRIVKRFLRDRRAGCVCPPDFPICVCGHEPAPRAS